MALLLKPEASDREITALAPIGVSKTREELVAQEFGFSEETVGRVWKVLEADVRREIEAALRLKYSLHFVAWVILLTDFGAATAANNPLLVSSVVLLTAITQWVGIRAYCQKMTNYDISWERKVAYVYSVWMAMAHPKPGDEVALHTPLIQTVMLVAHEPAREELARRRLRVAISDMAYCGKVIRAKMAKDIVTAFGATPKVGDLTIYS